MSSEQLVSVSPASQTSSPSSTSGHPKRKATEDTPLDEAPATSMPRPSSRDTPSSAGARGSTEGPAPPPASTGPQSHLESVQEQRERRQRREERQQQREREDIEAFLIEKAGEEAEAEDGEADAHY